MGGGAALGPWPTLSGTVRASSILLHLNTGFQNFTQNLGNEIDHPVDGSFLRHWWCVVRQPVLYVSILSVYIYVYLSFHNLLTLLYGNMTRITRMKAKKLRDAPSLPQIK